MGDHFIVSLPQLTAPEDVYTVLWAHCDGDGVIQMSQAEIGRLSGHPTEVARAALVLLMSANYVQRTARGDRTNGATTYRVAPPEPEPGERHLRLVGGEA